MHFGKKEYPYQAIKKNYFSSNYDDLLIRRKKTQYTTFWDKQKDIKDFIVHKKEECIHVKLIDRRKNTPRRGLRGGRGGA